MPNRINLEDNIPYVIYMQDSDESEGMHTEHFCIRKMGEKMFIAEISDKQLGNAKVEFFCSDKPLKQKAVKIEEKRSFWQRLLMFWGVR